MLGGGLTIGSNSKDTCGELNHWPWDYLSPAPPPELIKIYYALQNKTICVDILLLLKINPKLELGLIHFNVCPGCSETSWTKWEQSVWLEHVHCKKELSHVTSHMWWQLSKGMNSHSWGRRHSKKRWQQLKWTWKVNMENKRCQRQCWSLRGIILSNILHCVFKDGCLLY